MKKLIIASIAALGLMTPVAMANDSGWGGKVTNQAGFNFTGKFNVMNEGAAYGDKTKVGSSSWKDLSGGGSAWSDACGCTGSTAFVNVGGGTSGFSSAFSSGPGSSEAGTMETGAINGSGSVTTWKRSTYSW